MLVRLPKGYANPWFPTTYWNVQFKISKSSEMSVIWKWDIRFIILIGYGCYAEFKAPCNNKKRRLHRSWSLGQGTPSAFSTSKPEIFIHCVRCLLWICRHVFDMADTTVNLDDERRQTGKTVFSGTDFTDLTVQQITDAKETFLDLESYWRRFRFEIDNLKENHRGEVRISCHAKLV